MVMNEMKEIKAKIVSIFDLESRFSPLIRSILVIPFVRMGLNSYNSN